MADSLAAINARNLAAPRNNAFLNVARVAALKGELAKVSGAEAYVVRHTLAEEQLKAGQSREAIDGLERLIHDAGLSWEHITPDKRPVFDLLALAYLRLGEQENCANNAIPNVCILPLDGDAKHSKQEGARGAINAYTRLLQQFPDDHGSRYLLNIAYLQIGGYPDSIPKALLVKGLAPNASNTFPLYENVAGRVGLGIVGLAGGVNIADFNGDGLLDVFTTSWGISDPVHVMLADGSGGYVDQTAKSGLSGIVGGLNTIHADYDNDGHEDILILRGAWMGEAGNYPVSLLRGHGDGTFEDVTFAAGLYSVGATNTAAWADFNGDGYLDLFIGYESRVKTVAGAPSHKSKLFLNNRNGTFTEVADKVGINLDEFVKGAVWGDINNDGLPDLFVSVLYGKNKLYLNKGGTSIENWRFEEGAAAAGVEQPLASFPAFFFDFDNDGWQDLLVLSYDVNAPLEEYVAREMLGRPTAFDVGGNRVGIESAKLYRNKRDGTFEDATIRMGLEKKVLFAMGTNFGDLDNDGWLDFYVGTGGPDLRSVIPNRMFRSVEGKRFDEVTLPGGFGHIQKGHAVAFADMDRDGNEDIFSVIGGAYDGDPFASVLFKNPGWPSNKWITLELEGRAANRSAIGARVEVVVTEADGHTRSIWRTVDTGGSFGAGPLQLHVGLGPATTVQAVNVRWPDHDSTRSSYAGLALNTFYRVVQGEAPTTLNRPPVPFRIFSLSNAPAMEMKH